MTQQEEGQAANAMGLSVPERAWGARDAGVSRRYATVQTHILASPAVTCYPYPAPLLRAGTPCPLGGGGQGEGVARRACAKPIPMDRATGSLPSCHALNASLNSYPATPFDASRDRVYHVPLYMRACPSQT